jgi:hypothetical protein
MNIIEKYNRQFEYAGILMTLLIAFQFYRLWQNPVIGDTPKIITMGLLIIFEFIMVHSGMLMAGLPKKVSLFGLIPFYGLFALAFCAIAQDPFILIIYLLVVFNRMRFAFSDIPKILKQQTLLKSILAGLAYFMPVFFIIFNAKAVPKWGMTQDTLSAIGYPGDSKAANIFFDMPHVVIAIGFIYYCLLAIIEAFSLTPRFGAPLIKHPEI